MKSFVLGIALLSSLPAAAEQPADPWSLAPELPTACYSGEDDFAQRISTARKSNADALSRQTEINAALQDQLNNLDQTEKQQHFMAFMMDNPQEAQEFMMSLNTMGAEAQERAPELMQQQQQLDDEFAALNSRYDAELETALAPLQQQFGMLPDGEGVTAADRARGAELLRQMNADYDQLCGTWWNNGPFHAWLARDREFLQKIAADAVAQDVTLKEYAIYGIPTDGYHPRDELQAVEKYLGQAEQVFNKRWPQRRVP